MPSVEEPSTIQLLEALAEASTPIGLPDIETESGITVEIAEPRLAILIAAGYAEKSDDERWRITAAGRQHLVEIDRGGTI